MKRFTLITGLLVVLFAASMVNFSFAQDATQVKQQKQLRDGSHDGQPTQDQKRIQLKIQDPLANYLCPNFVDLDGDGINDNRGAGIKSGNSGRNKSGKGGYGLKDGSGSRTRPQDGTGFGAKTGDCDGTGPKGSAKRGGQNK